MNWLLVGLPLLGIYIIWFGFLLFKKQYSKSLLYFALAHIPYLLVNLVAPFRGLFDPSYAGYAFGWVQLPKGISVTLVVGFIVISCLLLASRALQNKMAGWWKLAFVFDLAIFIMIAFPVFLDVITDISSFTIELGEYLKISGVWVALLVLGMFTIPTGFACYFASKQIFGKSAASIA